MVIKNSNWTFNRILILFIIGLFVWSVIGSLSVDVGLFFFFWAPPLAWYIFYRGYKELLLLEVEDGNPPSLLIKVAIFGGLFASSWMFLAILSSFTFLLLIPTYLLSQKYWLFLTSAQFVWFNIIYVAKIHGNLSSMYKNSLFDREKNFLLYIGTISAIVVFAINAYFLHSQTEL